MTFEWPVDRSSFPALPALDAAEYPAKLAERDGAESDAIMVLWALTGRQFGLRTLTVRPCRVPLHTEYRGSGGVTSYLLSWEGFGWVSLPCGCPGSCTATGPNVVHLPGPVHSVESVDIGGVAVDPAVWTVEGNLLYRRDAPWPHQDMNRPLGDVNTWGVTYKQGVAVPLGVAGMTGVLAKEFITALNNNGVCRLPRTVTTASRQGVTYRAYDPAVIYATGKTGLPEIDMWLAAVNPHALMAAPTVR